MKGLILMIVQMKYLSSKDFFKEPMLLNINTNRIFWHSGAGKDSDDIFDRYQNEKNIRKY